MGRNIIIYGKSGSGKSRSLKNFSEDEIFLANCSSKDLPFRKKFNLSCNVNFAQTIISGLQKMPTKTAVIDDETFIMTDAFMRGHGGKVNQFDLYNNIADSMYEIFQTVAKLPDDVNVYHILHEDKNDMGDVKLKTIGKLLDSKCPLESMTTICLRCMTDGERHYFRTQSDGYDISKSPEDMFEAVEIENDLKKVDDIIREYYGG